MPQWVSYQRYVPSPRWVSLCYLLRMDLAKRSVTKAMQIFSNFHSFTDEISKTRSIESKIDWSLIYILYSHSLIIYLALMSRNLESGYYADMIAAYMKVRLCRRICLWSQSETFKGYHSDASSRTRLSPYQCKPSSRTDGRHVREPSSLGRLL